MQKYQIDTLVICGNRSENERHLLPWTGENSYEALVRKFYPKVEVISFGHMHHLAHAASAFYGSGFDSAASLVVDGCGTFRRFPDIEDFPEKDKFTYFETTVETLSLVFISSKYSFGYFIIYLKLPLKLPQLLKSLNYQNNFFLTLP